MVEFKKSSDTILKLMSDTRHLASIDTHETDSEFSKIFTYCKPENQLDEDLILLSVILYLFEIN